MAEPSPIRREPRPLTGDDMQCVADLLEALNAYIENEGLPEAFDGAGIGRHYSSLRGTIIYRPDEGGYCFEPATP